MRAGETRNSLNACYVKYFISKFNYVLLLSEKNIIHFPSQEHYVNITRRRTSMYVIVLKGFLEDVGTLCV